MDRLSRFLLRHRLVVGLCWLAVLVVGIATAGTVSGRLATNFSLPGAKSYETNQAILRLYGNGGDTRPLVPVVTLPAGTTVDSPGVRATLDRSFGAVARDPRLRVVSWASTGDRAFVSADGRTTFGLVFTPPTGRGGPDLGPAVATAMGGALPPAATLRVTGFDELSASDGGGGTGVLIETLLGGLGALAVLAFVFGSLLALVPLLIAAVSILATFLVILGLTTFTEVNFIVQFLVALIGLGVAIDYSLLLVTRWREELAHGHSVEEAVHLAMASAGRAVILSGVTVAIGLLALVLLPVPFLRSVGFGGMLIPLVSVLVAVTLLPVLLATVGRRLDWPRLRSENLASRGWTAWAHGVVRARWAAALGAAKADTLATSGPAAEGLATLSRAGVPAGVLSPIEVLVPAGADPVTAATRLASVPRVRDAAAAELPGVRVGGSGASLIDGVHAIYGNFPLMLGVIAAVTFVLLARAFRSLLLPVKAVLLNLASVGATYGVLVLVWQRGYGSHAIWGIPATGAITFWVPLMTFAFLYGLSMDYEVFILARMREEYDRSGSTTTAITEGLGRTGRLVTSAALILFLSFVSLASAPGTDIKIMATGLGAGILLDATVVRALLVPALVSLFGRWNWWLPSWAARLMRVAPAMAHAEQANQATSPSGREVAQPSENRGTSTG